MKSSLASDTDQEGSWRTFVSALLVTMASAVTVLGAILLSLQGQVQSLKPVVRVPEITSGPIDVIPTAAIATVPPDDLIPTEPFSGTVEPIQVETPSLPSPTSDTLPPETSPASGTITASTTIPPTATPRPCGGVPLYWKLYIVRRGDTLFSLARRHRTTMDLIIFYNCLQNTDIWAGQRLYLPPLPTPVPSATATATATPSPTPTAAPPPPPPPPSSTPAPTLTPTLLPSATTTAMAEPTSGPTATATVTATVTATGTPTTTPVLTPTASVTPDATATPSATPSSLPIATETFTQTPNPSPTPTPIPTPTETPVP